MKFPTANTQQFLTATLLTVFVFGLQFAVPPAQMRAAIDARDKAEFGLKLRTLAHETAMIEACIDEGLILIGAEGEEPSPPPPPELNNPFATICVMASFSIPEPVPASEHIQLRLANICPEETPKENPEKATACAATLLAFGATQHAAKTLEGLEAKDDMAELLISLTISKEERAKKDVLFATELDGVRLPEVVIALFQLQPPPLDPSDYSGELLHENDALPGVVVHRLEAIYADATGEEDKGETIRASLRQAEQDAFKGQVGLVFFEGFSVLLGLLLLLLLMIPFLRTRFFAPFEKLTVPTVTIAILAHENEGEPVARKVDLEGERPTLFLGPFPITSLNLYTIFIGWIAFQIILSYAIDLPVVNAVVGDSPPLKAFILMFAMGAFPIFLIWKLAPPLGESLHSALGFRLAPLKKAWLRSLSLPYLAFCFWLPLSFVLTIVTLSLIGQPPIDTNPIISLVINARGSFEIMLIAIAAVIVAPVFEEALFRGFLYRVLRARAGAVGGAVITSVIFAAIHPSMITFLPLFGLSCLLCWLYERTGSILPSVALHGINNLVALTAVATALRDITT